MFFFISLLLEKHLSPILENVFTPPMRFIESCVTLVHCSSVQANCPGFKPCLEVSDLELRSFMFSIFMLNYILVNVLLSIS